MPVVLWVPPTISASTKVRWSIKFTISVCAFDVCFALLMRYILRYTNGGCSYHILNFFWLTSIIILLARYSDIIRMLSNNNSFILGLVVHTVVAMVYFVYSICRIHRWKRRRVRKARRKAWWRMLEWMCDCVILDLLEVFLMNLLSREVTVHGFIHLAYGGENFKIKKIFLFLNSYCLICLFCTNII